MPSKPFDPLSVIPSPEAIRARLAETQILAARLRVLLDVAERIRVATPTDFALEPTEAVKGDARG